MKGIRLLALVLLLVLGTGCGSKPAAVQNEDDGKLRLDAEHTVDFYRGNDDAGTDPITEQILAILSGTKPESVKDADGWEFGAGARIARYRFNGATVRLLTYSDGDRTLLDVALGENHALSGGVRLGSTEAELLACYEGREGLSFYGYDLDGDDVRVYVLYGPWYERYLIFFEVDAATGRIVSISYELDS